MNHHKKFILIPIALAGALAVSGCSNKPTDDQLTQLESVQSEIKSLEQQKAKLEQEKTGLQQSIAQQEAQLNTCENDKNAVKAKLHQ